MVLEADRRPRQGQEQPETAAQHPEGGTSSCGGDGCGDGGGHGSLRGGWLWWRPRCGGGSPGGQGEDSPCTGRFVPGRDRGSWAFRAPGGVRSPRCRRERPGREGAVPRPAGTLSRVLGQADRTGSRLSAPARSSRRPSAAHAASKVNRPSSCQGTGSAWPPARRPRPRGPRATRCPRSRSGAGSGRGAPIPRSAGGSRGGTARTTPRGASRWSPRSRGSRRRTR